MTEDSGIYREHEEKLAVLEARRSRPFDESRLAAVADIDGLLDILTGDMILPEEVEAKIWTTLAGATMEAGGEGIDIRGTKWSLLDMLLAVATRTDEFPILLLVEVMLASDHIVVSLRGRPVHAGQLYNITYDGWSTMDDLKERARHHFKFGFLLITIEEPERAADQLLLALEVDADSSATDLLKKLLEAKGGSLTTTNGRHVTIKNDKIVATDADPTVAAAAAREIENHAGPAAASSSAGAPTTASTGSSKKTLIAVDDEKSTGSSFGTVAVIAAVAVLGITGFVAYRVSSSRSSR
jgi:hypothetical protein